MAVTEPTVKKKMYELQAQGGRGAWQTFAACSTLELVAKLWTGHHAGAAPVRVIYGDEVVAWSGPDEYARDPQMGELPGDAL